MNAKGVSNPAARLAPKLPVESQCSGLRRPASLLTLVSSRFALNAGVRVWELLARVHVLNAVTLVAEAARMSEGHPAAVLALIDIPRRAASALIVWNVYGKRVKKKARSLLIGPPN